VRLINKKRKKMRNNLFSKDKTINFALAKRKTSILPIKMQDL